MEPVVVFSSLVLARVGTFVAILPLFGTANTPRLAKVGLTMALTAMYLMLLVPQKPDGRLFDSSAPVPWLAWGIALGREALLGAALGYAFALLLAPARIAGEFLSQEMGLAFGSLINGTGESPAGPLPQIMETFAVLLLLGMDGHHVFFAVLHSTFATYPLGGAILNLPMPEMIQSMASAEEYGIALVAPVALCLFVTTMILALMARAAPQMNLYAVGFPLRLLVGIASLLILLPNVMRVLWGTMVHMTDLVPKLVLGG